MPSPASSLLFDASDLPRIRANLDSPRLAELRATLFPTDLPAREKFLREEVRLENLMYDMAKVRTHLEQSAFAYAVSGDAAQLAIAKLALRRLCEYQRWDYFLEAGNKTIGLQRAPEATIASVLALDWLGDQVTPEERALVEDSIIRKGAPACYTTLYGMKHPDRVRGWTQDPREKMPFVINMARWPLILNSTNLKVIPICGLGYAAIHFHGRHPEAGKWLELARLSARAFAEMYGTDGAYDEGVGYWGYTTMHMILFAEALYRRLGIDDRKLINYPGTVRYALSMTMPTQHNPKEAVNFGDAAAVDTTVAAWVGRVYDDPVSDYVVRHVGGVGHWPAAIWCRPEAAGTPPGPELNDVRLSNDLVISRSGWTANDGVVALRSGGPANHEHADRNSVVFKVHGERFFHDPYGGGYNTMVPKWRLRFTEAHSAVLVGGQGHQYHDGSEGTNSSWAEARVKAFRHGPGWMTVTSDATEAYALVNPAVRLVERTLVYLKPDVVLILDRVQLETAATVQVRYQLFNDDGRGAVAAAGAGFTITRPLAALTATAHGAGPLVVRTGRMEFPANPGPYQTSVASVQEYAEIESAAAKAHTVLTVAAAAPGGAPAKLTVTAAPGGWRVEGLHGGRAIRAELVLKDGALPEVKVPGA